MEFKHGDRVRIKSNVTPEKLAMDMFGAAYNPHEGGTVQRLIADEALKVVPYDSLERCGIRDSGDNFWNIDFNLLELFEDKPIEDKPWLESPVKLSNKKQAQLLPRIWNNIHGHYHSNGGGFVANTAHADDTAYVGGNAKVYDNAKVYYEAKVYENAKVYGNAQVWDNARVYDNAEVFGYASVYNKALIYGNAKVYGNAQVDNNFKVFGNAVLSSGVYSDGKIDKPINDKPWLESPVKLSTRKGDENVY